MNAHAERDTCKYCQIDLVDVQQLMALPTQFTRAGNKQTTPSVLKCPVCGYSELGKPSFVQNHISSKIAIIGYQAPAA